MTLEETIKALEFCTSGILACKGECPFFGISNKDKYSCREYLINKAKNALLEVEALKIENEKLREQNKTLIQLIGGKDAEC